jgi:hypothetical protein
MIFPDQVLPQKIPFMPTSLSQLQAQGWKKWLSRITFTKRTNCIKSIPIGINSYPALALLNPRSGNETIVMKL